MAAKLHDKPPRQ